MEQAKEANFFVDGYCMVFKLAVESDDEKLMVATLDFISVAPYSPQMMLSQRAFDGRGQELSKSVQQREELTRSGDKEPERRCLSDSVVDLVCYCSKVQSEPVLFRVCKVGFDSCWLH